VKAAGPSVLDDTGSKVEGAAQNQTSDNECAYNKSCLYINTILC
jgi:hypothetical protein